MSNFNNNIHILCVVIISYFSSNDYKILCSLFINQGEKGQSGLKGEPGMIGDPGIPGT